jgi:hypothetical protein
MRTRSDEQEGTEVAAFSQGLYYECVDTLINTRLEPGVRAARMRPTALAVSPRARKAVETAWFSVAGFDSPG